MVYLTIVRHGETVNNVARIVQSRTHGELTEKGILMAKSLGMLLKDEEFTHIFSSDLKRCVDTTQNILDNLGSKNFDPNQVHYWPLLRERDFGDWELQPSQLAWTKRNEMGLPFHKSYQVEIPNGESYAQCKARGGQFFEEILQLVEEETSKSGRMGNVLVVTHGNLIACFLEHLMETGDQFELVGFEDDDLKRRFENTARTRFFVQKINYDPAAPITTPAPSPRQRWRLTFSHVFDVTHLRGINN